ncbi:DNA repair helicase, partial [Aureobasidium melanogenum]
MRTTRISSALDAVTVWNSRRALRIRDSVYWKGTPMQSTVRPKTAPRPLLQAVRMSLCFQTWSRMPMPCHMEMMLSIRASLGKFPEERLYRSVKAESRESLFRMLQPSSRVLTNDVRRSAQKRKGFLSIKVSSLRCWRKDGGVSEMTCSTFMRVLRYSTKRLRKATKCSALRMFPGTASLSRSSGSAGFLMKAPSSFASSASRRPCTSFAYSFCNFAASVVFISLIFFSRFAAPLPAFRNESSKVHAEMHHRTYHSSNCKTPGGIRLCGSRRSRF